MGPGAAGIPARRFACGARFPAGVPSPGAPVRAGRIQCFLQSEVARMRLYFPVPAAAGGEGVLLRSFLRECRLSTDLLRAIKFHGGGFEAGGRPVQIGRAHV